MVSCADFDTIIDLFTVKLVSGLFFHRPTQINQPNNKQAALKIRVVVESPTGKSESESESPKTGTRVGLESESRVRVLQLWFYEHGELGNRTQVSVSAMYVE